jgi:hypothetical protein
MHFFPGQAFQIAGLFAITNHGKVDQAYFVYVMAWLRLFANTVAVVFESSLYCGNV